MSYPARAEGLVNMIWYNLEREVAKIFLGKSGKKTKTELKGNLLVKVETNHNFKDVKKNLEFIGIWGQPIYKKEKP